ncbi:cell wall metabolism sensor histidine kinase WalK [Cohnella sp. REN36]|uniref:sensor histidine kinase n=1 Tax=Cohnella sp. REN36 TaxID=2887347 RepID=UPI001D13D932|nr:HAMP domain-containing sensor histidine kinase [Cohnella sp. REN36]MCC3377072.1 HAMP domain-containing histidine kinase [Cohnella sp. REN36]
MSIRLRLTLWYSGLLAATLVAFGLILYTVVFRNTMGQLKDRLSFEANKIIKSQVLTANPISGELNLGRSYTLDAIIGVQVVSYSQNVKGVVYYKSPILRGNVDSQEITFHYPEASRVATKFKTEEVQGLTFLVYETPLGLEGTGQLVGLLQVATYIGKEQEYFGQMRTILWTAGLAGLVLAFALGLFLARKALRPIERVTEAAEKIQIGSDLKLRIPGESQDEIGRLTRTLNHMLGRVERAYNDLEESNTAQRRFVSDASHELRTPLTTIRGNVDLLAKIWAEPPAALTDGTIEGDATLPRSRLSPLEREEMSREAIHDIADEARRMSRLVNDLLSLARADAGYVMDKERLPLLPLAEEAARRAVFLPRHAAWVVGSLEPLRGVWVVGNRDYLLQLLFILIENGFKYTPAGEVRLEAIRRDDRVGLSVVDTGIGLAEEEIPHIFDRFYRADVSRGQTSGTGLGLSIAKWIADMHRAQLEVQSQPEGGSRFTLWLPVDFSPSGDYDIIETSARPTTQGRNPA